MSEKPSEWIKRRKEEIQSEFFEPTSAGERLFNRLTATQWAIIEYLDAQHEAKSDEVD